MLFALRLEWLLRWRLLLTIKRHESLEAFLESSSQAFTLPFTTLIVHEINSGVSFRDPRARGNGSVNARSRRRLALCLCLRDADNAGKVRGWLVCLSTERKA